jgi:hypothetical protein
MEAHISLQEIQVASYGWKGLVECFETPKGLSSNIKGERDHVKKCKLLQHAKILTEASYLHKTERKVIIGFFVA